MKKAFLSVFTCLLLICSINPAFGADTDKEITIMIPLYQETNEEYTLRTSLYTYGIRLMEITKCDKELFPINQSCVNTIELNIVQRNKYTNEIIKTVVVPDLIKVREIPMSVEFEDIKFNSVFVVTIYFDQGAANFKLTYTEKDVLKGMIPIYSGEMIETPISAYFGSADTLYSIIVNRSENKLIVNVKTNTQSETHYGISDEIISFGNIRVKVLNLTDNGIKFIVYSTPNLTPMSKSEVTIKNGDTFNIGGVDFKVADVSSVSATIKVDAQDYPIRKRSVKTINNLLFELIESGADNATINIYHPESINITEYSPNVTLTVTKKLESQEGDTFDIPFTIANTGKVNADGLEISLQGTGLDVVEGLWKGSLKSGETKELIFKAKYKEPGEHTLNLNVNSGQSIETFQKDVTITSKVSTMAKEGSMPALIFIVENYIVTQDRIKLLQNSMSIFFYLGVIVSGAIIFYSSIQALPKNEPPKQKVVKKKLPPKGAPKRPPQKERPPVNGVSKEQKTRRRKVEERR